MTAMRRVRCPRCRLQLESVDAAPTCSVCGGPVDNADAEQTFENDTPEKMPTQPNAIIRPEK
jgi:hypothetical protein